LLSATSFAIFRIKRVQRALRYFLHITEDMRIDHSSLNILMAEQVLNFPDVYPTLEQVCRKTVAECVYRCMLYNTRFFNGICERGLDNVFTYMVASDLAASGVNG
jgi:hypothetical protein